MIGGSLRNRIWILSIVLIGIGLYPIQRYMKKRADALDIVLAKAQLGPYRINVPDKTFNLPTYLDEISGLSTTGVDSLLVAIQDEEGILFFINKETGEINHQVKFGDTGDYEGVEVLSGLIFVTNSKGDLFRVEIDKSYGAISSADKVKTWLNSDDNIEGLGHLPGSDRLLLASKDARKKPKELRYIYQFDLVRNELDTTPFLVLDGRAIADILDRDVKPIFSPSALAVHPINKEIYILSSPAAAIIRVDQHGSIHEAARLDRRIHRQPEGMAFGQDGTLFISNEARNGLAKLHVFEPITID